MSAPFGRIIAQLVMFTVNVTVKAFAQAVQQAQRGGAQGAAAAAAAGRSATSSSRIALDEARAILNIEASEATALSHTGMVTRINEQFKRYYDANDVEKGGSFYIQSKIWNAKEALLEDLRRTAPASAAGSGQDQELK